MVQLSTNLPTNMEITMRNTIIQYCVYGYCNSPAELNIVEQLVFNDGLVSDNHNWNETGSWSGSFEYNVLPENINEMMQTLQLLGAYITAVRAYNENGQLIDHDIELPQE